MIEYQFQLLLRIDRRDGIIRRTGNPRIVHFYPVKDIAPVAANHENVTPMSHGAGSGEMDLPAPVMDVGHPLPGFR